MSERPIHYIPHPLCQSDPKIKRNDLENIDDYIKDSPNPTWAASHLVRAISQGLLKVDVKTAMILSEIADQLASQSTLLKD